MGLFGNRRSEPPKKTDGGPKMRHCLIFDIYFFLTSEDYCRSCKFYNECREYKGHRDFEDGELFFGISNGKPFPFAYVTHTAGYDGMEMKMYDGNEAKPKEKTISLIQDEFENFVSVMNYLKGQLPSGFDPDVVTVETEKGDIRVPIKSICRKLSEASKTGPDKNGRYHISLNAQEATETFRFVCAGTDHFPLVGYLSEESFIRKIHSLIPVLSDQLIATV